MIKILTVDDRLFIRKGIANYLNNAFPVEVCHALTLSQLPKFLEKNPGSYLIITDLTNPVKIESLRTITHGSPILIYTAQKYTEFDLLTCLSTGANGYIAKGSEESNFLAAVLAIMEGRTYFRGPVKEHLIQVLKNRASLKKT